MQWPFFFSWPLLSISKIIIELAFYRCCCCFCDFFFQRNAMKNKSDVKLLDIVNCVLLCRSLHLHSMLHLIGCFLFFYIYFKCSICIFIHRVCSNFRGTHIVYVSPVIMQLKLTHNWWMRSERKKRTAKNKIKTHHHYVLWLFGWRDPEPILNIDKQQQKRIVKWLNWFLNL